MDSPMEKALLGRKTGIMGGTFNPIHNGHLLLAEAALKQEALDKVVFIPSGCSYRKRNTDVLEAGLRLEMVKAAIAGRPSFEFSDMEIKRAGNTYTYETLIQLKEASPCDAFYFILGADCLFSMENWKFPEAIFKRCTVLAAVRNHINTDSVQKKAEELQAKYGAAIKLLEIPQTDISSTFIRKQLALGKKIDSLVPEAVSRYIREKALYQ